MKNPLNEPRLSVVCVTYNQEKYVAQAIESLISQRTNFDFEVIVADDKSTDNTPKIIKKFAASHPDIIRPVLRKKNVGVAKNFWETLRVARGEYIALCEGDDYWTDAKKLQKQVDFLDRNPDYALCFHPVKVFFENNEQEDFIYPREKQKNFDTKGLLKENFIQTNSVVYRKQDYKNMPSDILPVDWYLHLYHAKFGKIGFIDEVMAAYRRHSDGVWWDAIEGDKIWEKYGLNHILLFVGILKLYGDNLQNKKIIVNHISNSLYKLIEFDRIHKTRLFKEALNKFPEDEKDIIFGVIDVLEKATSELKKHSEEQAKVIKHLDNELADKTRQFDNAMKVLNSTQKELGNLNKEIEIINNSTTLRAIRKLHRRK